MVVIKVKDIWRVTNKTIIVLEELPSGGNKVLIEGQEFVYDLPYDLPNSIAVNDCEIESFTEVTFV